MYKKILILIIASFIFAQNANATVWRAGEVPSNPTSPCKASDLKRLDGIQVTEQGNEWESMLFKRFCDLEVRSTELENKVKQLEGKQTGQVIKETIVVQDSTKIDALEKRVSLLEKAVSSIQTVVLSAINKAIEILEKLLK